MYNLQALITETDTERGRITIAIKGSWLEFAVTKKTLLQLETKFGLGWSSGPLVADTLLRVSEDSTMISIDLKIKNHQKNYQIPKECQATLN